jgi:hypothetical protein
MGAVGGFCAGDAERHFRNLSCLVAAGQARIDERVGYDRIPDRRAELARDVHAAVAKTDPAAVDRPTGAAL